MSRPASRVSRRSGDSVRTSLLTTSWRRTGHRRCMSGRRGGCKGRTSSPKTLRPSRNLQEASGTCRLGWAGVSLASSRLLGLRRLAGVFAAHLHAVLTVDNFDSHNTQRMACKSKVDCNGKGPGADPLVPYAWDEGDVQVGPGQPSACHAFFPSPLSRFRSPFSLLCMAEHVFRVPRDTFIFGRMSC